MSAPEFSKLKGGWVPVVPSADLSRLEGGAQTAGGWLTGHRSLGGSPSPPGETDLLLRSGGATRPPG
jgi:hypothetical protein